MSGPDIDSPKMATVRLDHGAALSLQLHPASTLKHRRGWSVKACDEGVRERMIQLGLVAKHREGKGRGGGFELLDPRSESVTSQLPVGTYTE